MVLSWELATAFIPYQPNGRVGSKAKLVLIINGNGIHQYLPR